MGSPCASRRQCSSEERRGEARRGDVVCLKNPWDRIPTGNVLEGDLRLVLMEIPVYGFYAEERGRASGWRDGVFIHPANSSASLVGGSRRQLVGLVLESQTTLVPYSGLGGGWGNGEQTGRTTGGGGTQTRYCTARG